MSARTFVRPTHRIPELFRFNVLQRYWEVNQEQINITKSPGFVLCFSHLQSMLSTVIVVPQFRRHEDLLPLDKALVDRPLDPLAGLSFVLIIICPVEETIAHFNGVIDDIGRIFCWHLPKTEPNQRHFVAGGQGDCFHRHVWGDCHE